MNPTVLSSNPSICRSNREYTTALMLSEKRGEGEAEILLTAVLVLGIREDTAIILLPVCGLYYQQE